MVLRALGKGFGNWEWEKMSKWEWENISEHWKVGFVKHMGWEMGLEPPLQDPLQKLIGGEPFVARGTQIEI